MTAIDNEINRIKQNIEESYNALEEKGATMPAERTSAYLLDTIESLSVGGVGGSIIYASELPSTPTRAIYVVTQDEVKNVEFIQGGEIAAPEVIYCEVVDVLPEEANPAVILPAGAMYTYYLTTDGAIYGYVDDALSAASGIPVGWHPAALLFSSAGIPYSGTITSMEQAIEISSMYALLTTEPKTRVYVPMQDGTFLELTSGIRTRFDEHSRTTSITEM